MVRNQKGFTLIEIIAVLIILGILAAVGVPKYVDMQSAAKAAAAQGQVAEVKSSLNLGYAKYFIQNSTKPNGSQAVTAASLTVGANTMGTTPDDWGVTLGGTADQVTISITGRGTDTAYAAAGTWNVPQ